METPKNLAVTVNKKTGIVKFNLKKWNLKK